MTHKAGYVNIIGNPNVGKSTLMNVLVGEKLSIITSKAQTTRHRILGIVNSDDYQIIFSDTPGIINKPAYKMHEVMNSYVNLALIDADLIMFVVDVTEKSEYEETISKIRNADVPIFVILNKIDLSSQTEVAAMILNWEQTLPGAKVFPVSASLSFNTAGLLDRILEILPESPPYFPKDELTDKSTRFFVTEIIREKILINYKQEIPYSVEVAVEAYEESEKLVRIQATIYASRDSQKAIIIGKFGSAIKRVGTTARIDIEAFIGKKVFLELNVKVNKDWRDNDNSLKRFGYEAY
ncbi:MAG: GTPase Era [Bacteroidetes bacterium HGW-Bacteroidetes-1]|jgi:GTP-binding protein Era|nr:MAG: GTPase Era [Bacteroidetes bacterium HGW-Bacteroidetes-1]